LLPRKEIRSEFADVCWHRSIELSFERVCGSSSGKNAMSLIASKIAAAALLSLVLAAPARADDIAAGNLVIAQAWSRASPGGAQVAAGYLSIENRGSVPERLLSGTTDFARKVEIHEMVMSGGIMTMRPMEGSLIIEPGKTVRFAPGGRHLMFVGLTAPLKEGEQVPVLLSFELAGLVAVPFAVQGIGASGPRSIKDVELPRPAAPTTATASDPDEPFFTHFCNPKAMANITVSPGRAGPVEIAIQLEDGDERPLMTAAGVSVTLASPDKGVAPVKALAQHVSGDKWIVRMDAKESGRWSLALAIDLSATDRVNIEAPILIR
jgi:copper(I)-binding protein